MPIKAVFDAQWITLIIFLNQVQLLFRKIPNLAAKHRAKFHPHLALNSWCDSVLVAFSDNDFVTLATAHDDTMPDHNRYSNYLDLQYFAHATVLPIGKSAHEKYLIEVAKG